MNTRRKYGLVFYGTILSAFHFTAALLLSAIPLLMLRFEDMVGSGETKPYWPPSRLRDAVEGIAGILLLPARGVYDFCPGMPEVAGVLVAILSSCLWGFGLALLLRPLLSRLRLSHETRPA